MRAWIWMLGGLIVWTIHFFGVYTIASAADVFASADDFVWRMGGLVFSVVCLIASLALLVIAVRRVRATSTLADQLAALGAGTAAIAIIWQALPNLIGY